MVKNRSPVNGTLYNLLYACATNSFDFFLVPYFLVPYKESELLILSSVKYRTFLFEPYTDDEA